jgi:acyl carrier protein
VPLSLETSYLAPASVVDVEQARAFHLCYTCPMTRRDLLSALTLTIATTPSGHAAYVIASPCAKPGRQYPACLETYTESELRNPEQLLEKLRASFRRGLRQPEQDADAPVNEEELRARLRGLFVGRFGVKEKAFVDSANLTKDLGLNKANVVSTLEAVFRIKISDQAARRFRTIGDTINYLKGRLKARDLAGDVTPEPGSILPCVDACPVDAIHPKEDEPKFGKTNMAYVDPVACIDCGACVPACPVRAVFPEDDLPDKWSHYSKINKDFYHR